MSIKIEHANAHGTGSALEVEAVKGNGLIFSLKPQKDIVPPTFDNENEVAFLLTFSEIGELLSVMRGIQESIREGRGIPHRGTINCSRIQFTHEIEPRHGYRLTIASGLVGASELDRCYIFLDTYEALSLCVAIESYMGGVFLAD